MRETRFALGYMPHRLWGNILQAQILEKESGTEFFVPREYVQNDESTRAYQRLTPMQKEAVGLVDAYSDRNLHRIFSRKGTVKEFLDTLDRKTIAEFIRPFIEKYLYKALEIARDNRIPLFTKDKSNRNVFPEDFIVIEKDPAEPAFHFVYAGGLSYTLDLHHKGRKLILTRGYVEIISNSPAVIIHEHSLYFINRIDGIKLKPFMKRESVKIPSHVEEKYFSTFVRNTLRDYDTQIEGFPVTETTAKRETELMLETGLNNRTVLLLTFRYNGQAIHADSPVTRFVHYSGKENGHAFTLFRRDLSWENEKIDAIKELGLRTRDDRLFYLSEKHTVDALSDLYAAVNFINETREELDGSEIRIRSRLGKPYYLGKIGMDLDSREKEEWFHVKGLARFGQVPIPFYKLRDHILQGQREYELPGGEIAILPEEWVTRYRSMFEFGKLKGEEIRIHKQHFSMMDGSVRVFHPETLERLEKLNETESIPAMEPPAGLHAEMRSYQREGYTWLCFLQQNGFGGCLADDMGLGKTLQAIAVLVRSKQLHELEDDREPIAPDVRQMSLFRRQVHSPTSLVVVPASLLHNWVREFSRFAPGLKVLAHMGIQRNRELSHFTRYDVIISTYHTLRQDIEQMADFNFHYVILDESQMIKNPSSKVYQAVTELNCRHRIVLTGTPIENSLTDLWAQVNFVNPGLLGSLSFFKKSFVQPIERRKDEHREEKLKELINPFILRRTKQEVARELPPVFEQVRLCSMTDDQRRAYEEEKSLARNSIIENLEEIGLEKSSILVLQALTRLRQIANHPAMLEEFAGTDSGKFSEVCRDVESVVSEGHRILMFSSFVKHLDLFRAEFQSLGRRAAAPFS
jgi:superfamily II DNA or RNA helicase